MERILENLSGWKSRYNENNPFSFSKKRRDCQQTSEKDIPKPSSKISYNEQIYGLLMSSV